MTTGSQVKQTIASLKGVQSTLKSFASVEKNNEAVEMLKCNALRIGSIISDMEKRVGELEFEEPQYKGF